MMTSAEKKKTRFRTSAEGKGRGRSPAQREGGVVDDKCRQKGRTVQREGVGVDDQGRENVDEIEDGQ